MEHQDLVLRLHTCRARRAAIAAAAAAEQARADQAQQRAAVARGHLTLAPDIRAALEWLGSVEHERAVGAHERILTALLRETLPDAGAAMEAVLDLGIERGVPALDIAVRKEAGTEADDVWEGMGGAVTNIVSAGLRAIAVVRARGRRFLVLDEPDCWIKPDHAALFAKVLADLADHLAVQIILVSHHDEDRMACIRHRIRLSRDNGVVVAHATECPTWTPEQPGIRAIRLQHIRAHTDTLLPLAPGITLIHGPNDIGKSAVAAALRAVADNAATPRIVQRGADRGRITLVLEGDHRVCWQRTAGPRGKVTVSLHAPGRADPLHIQDGTRGGPPAWLVEVLRIQPIADMDVMIGNQKMPVFLLNQPPAQRARVLTVGADAACVRTMSEQARVDETEQRQALDTADAVLEQARRHDRARAALPAPLADLPPQWGPRAQAAIARAAIARRPPSLPPAPLPPRRTSSPHQDCVRRATHAQRALRACPPPLPPPPAHPARAAHCCLDRARQAILPPLPAPTCPPAITTARLRDIARRARACRRPRLPPRPGLPPARTWSPLRTTIAAARQRAAAAAADASAAAAAETAWRQQHPACPMCGRVWTPNHCPPSA